jgi:fumarylacetoacetate (FAA) hydrolase
MILTTEDNGTLDGSLILVDSQRQWGLTVDHHFPQYSTLQKLLDDWSRGYPLILSLYKGFFQDEHLRPLSSIKLHSPLPRSYAWLDGSAFLHHVILVRKARKAQLPPNLYTVPLMYQGGSDSFLRPTEDITFLQQDYGLDFESEIAVITDFVPQGTKAHEAHQYIRLIVLVNDVTLRGLIPEELAQGFGFLQSKPSSAFAPFALTPEECGPYWKEGRLHLPVQTTYNQKFFGKPNAGVMHFSFFDLIEHASRTRPLAAGTVLGSGTVAEDKPGVGSSCLAEKRMLEMIEKEKMETPFMSPGDTIHIEVITPEGINLFGSISQKVVSK